MRKSALTDNPATDTAHARHGQAVRLSLAEWKHIVECIETTAALDSIRDKLAAIGITPRGKAGSYRLLRNLANKVRKQANV